ncbi:Apm2 protein [Maudiozyma humilis]|uniref:Apm2 protein n=1 Tax=Maudiozyma humilis TaxID=51915 RepID=A0AAV5S2Q2_MAUHU|nr:Apm2 protein [Kazachstania humilis]
MSSILYILSETLETLVARNLRAVPSLEQPAAQFKRLYHKGAPPVLRGGYPGDLEDNWAYVYIQRDSLFFVSVVGNDADAVETLHYLEQFYLLLRNYFDVKVLDKNLVLDNTVLVMELLDESIDFGFVQVTDAGLIRDYIRVKINLPELHTTQDPGSIQLEDDLYGSESDEERKKAEKRRRKQLQERQPARTTKQELGHLRKKVMQTWKGKGSGKKHAGVSQNSDNDGEGDDEDDDTFMNSDIAKTTVMAVSWRAKGIHYAKNEFFLDVIERVEYAMDYPSQTVRKNVIHGEIVCKSFLSGMPELRASINKILHQDKQFLASCKFHQCVDLANVAEGKEITFIPPDGDFVLCTYDLKRHVRDQPVIKMSRFEIKAKPAKHKLKMYVTIEPHFKPTNATSKLNVRIPLGRLFREYRIDLRRPLRFKCDSGKVLFNVSDDFLLWEVGAIKGGHGETQVEMAVEFSLFDQEAYDREQEELRNSMNPPPLVTGPRIEEIHKQVHEGDESKELKPEPLRIDFEIPYSTLSGTNVEYLKISEPQLQYQSFPWVRSRTVNADEYLYSL